MIQQPNNNTAAVGWDLRSLWGPYWPLILFVAAIVIIVLVLVLRRAFKRTS
jgi:ABC-type Fe3+-siderophore transport system permease subunit